MGAVSDDSGITSAGFSDKIDLKNLKSGLLWMGSTLKH